MKKLFLLSTAILLSLTAFASEAVLFADSQWIGAPWDGEEYVNEIIQPAPLLRKAFDAPARVVSAEARVSGLGFFEFYVNGRKMGDEVLCPNETAYSKRPGKLDSYYLKADDTHWAGCHVQYVTYDVTKALRKGTNVLAAVLGNGFFSTGRTRWVEPYGTPRFLCEVTVRYADGTCETIVSDSSWLAHRGPIVMNDMFDGEIYDARLEVPGWNTSDCDESGWEAVAVRKAPDGELVPFDPAIADRIVEVLKPRSITRLGDGSWEVDFGDYVTGWVRIHGLNAPEGTEVEMEFPIEVDGNGTYKYISNGSRDADYAPRFVWWTFRKAIVKGWPGELKASNLTAEVVHTDLPVTGHFECSNPLFNRINEIWKRTQTDNMHVGVPTDCPHREKGPYTGDGQVSCPAVMENFGAKAFYTKWLRDLRDVQDTLTGYVPNGAPWHPGCGGGVAWGSAMCIVPWEHYMHYGDISVLEENFHAMTQEVRYLAGNRLEDGTMYQQKPSAENPNYWMNLGEWCPPYRLAGENYVHTWYLWRCASFTANAAQALGKTEEAAYYKALADTVANAFHAKFYDPEAGCYDSGRGIGDSGGRTYGTGTDSGVGTGANIFALAMGVPSDRYDKVVAAVKAELEANDGHLNTGIFGTALFFEVLCANGMAEEAYAAMDKRDYPSFGWWVEQGADTFWEQWSGEASRNHPMMGGGLVWLYRDIAGLRCDAPGYSHITFRPRPLGDLTWASYSTETPLGEAAVRWKLRRGRMILRITVPKGSSATVVFPDGSSEETGPGRHVYRKKVVRS